MKKIFYESIDSFNFSKIYSADKIFCIYLLFDYWLDVMTKFKFSSSQFI